MRKIFNSVLGLLACFSISCQAQNLLENDFSSSAEKLNCVGRGVCQVSNGVLSSKGSFALFGNKVWTNYSGKTIHFLSKPVLLKMQTKCRYGQVSVTITVSTAMW